MTEKEASQFKVYAKDNLIWITQENQVEQTEDAITIHPDQVDLLVKWLHDEKAKLQQD